MVKWSVYSDSSSAYLSFIATYENVLSLHLEPHYISYIMHECIYKPLLQIVLDYIPDLQDDNYIT